MIMQRVRSKTNLVEDIEPIITFCTTFAHIFLSHDSLSEMIVLLFRNKNSNLIYLLQMT